MSPEANILVIEDDPSLAEWIADYLNANGYQASIADNGNEAIRLVEEDMPDIVILDINLPGKNGFIVCQELRKFYDRPVLMLTARGNEEDEVSGIKAGANDYLVKPVRPRALIARLQSLLERDTGAGSTLRSFGAFSINADSRSVQLDGEPVHLSSNEFDLLWLLACNAGEVMTREDIVSQLRGIEYDGFDRSVDILVSRVRRKLDDDPAQPYRIKTVRAKGYLFALDGW